MKLVSPRPNITKTRTAQAVILEREHWDGAVDVKVAPDAVRARVKPSWGDWLRLMEFEYAGAELRRAKSSGDAVAIRRANGRFQRARAAVGRVKFDERVTEAMRHVF